MSLAQQNQTNETLIILENGKTFTIEVSVPKIANEKGKVLFGLYTSAENFNKRNALQNITGTIENNSTKVTFKNVPAGSYAIACYHDANDNNKMDFDGYMPIEDYGMTNNVMQMGPPQFNDGKFELTDKDLIFEIKF
jgi:uncharacterized protein (DUF2141 family)